MLRLEVAGEVVFVARTVVAERARELGLDAALVVQMVAQRRQEFVGTATARALEVALLVGGSRRGRGCDRRRRRPVLG